MYACNYPILETANLQIRTGKVWRSLPRIFQAPLSFQSYQANSKPQKFKKTKMPACWISSKTKDVEKILPEHPFGKHASLLKPETSKELYFYGNLNHCGWWNMPEDRLLVVLHCTARVPNASSTNSLMVEKLNSQVGEPYLSPGHMASAYMNNLLPP